MYIDNMLIFTPNVHLMNDVKSFLFNNKFNIKDAREANMILGTKLTRSVSNVTLSWSYYTKEVLEKYGYLDYGPIITPFAPIETLKNKGEPVDQDHNAQKRKKLPKSINAKKKVWSLLWKYVAWSCLMHMIR